ncbi:MAG: hypothetical protein ACI4JK_10315 [Oscillospiraceae bacterium]
MSKLISFFVLLISIFFICTACEKTEESSTGILSFTIDDLSSEAFYEGVTGENYKLLINGRQNYEVDDINVVISNPEVIDISFEKKDGLFDSYISFNITGKKTGASSFYFETYDEIVKSETIEVSVEKNIKSISFNEATDLIFYSWMNEEECYFNVDANENLQEIEEELEFISENTEIATIINNENSWLNSCIISKVGAGETYVYIQTKDGTVKSEKKKVIVEDDVVEESETYITDFTTDNSRTVFLTPYGDKYHYSKSCAGDNASETTLNSVKGFYDPCKKCVK